MQSTGSSFAARGHPAVGGPDAARCTASTSTGRSSPRWSASTTSPRTRSTSPPPTSPTARSRPSRPPSLPLPVHARRGRRPGSSCTTSPATTASRSTASTSTPQVIDQIFLGEITTWNDPAIAADQPAAGRRPPQHQDRPRLPDRRLGGELPAVRLPAAPGRGQLQRRPERLPRPAASSGPASPPPAGPPRRPASPYNQQTYPGWAAGNPVGQNGSDNAANYVSSLSSQGSITYVETAYAKEHNFPVASLAERQRTATSSPPRSTWPPPWRRPSSTPTSPRT